MEVPELMMAPHLGDNYRLPEPPSAKTREERVIVELPLKAEARGGQQER